MDRTDILTSNTDPSRQH